MFSGKRTVIPSLVVLMLLSGMGCNDERMPAHLDRIDKNKYYSHEILPEGYRKLYGKWRLVKVSGGFSGSGHEPAYEYLEIKSIGIYGLVKNDSLFEYGKIELDTFDARAWGNHDHLQVKFISDAYSWKYSAMSPPEKYLYLKDNGATLDLVSPCCDMYDYHYQRAGDCTDCQE